MRIAVVGAGGTGGYFGGLLARAGQDVTFIARGAHLLQPSKRLNHNAVPTVLEKAPRVASTDSRERLPHRLHQGLAGSGLDFAEEVLYLGEGFFDGVKVRRVGRQVQQLCSSLLEQCAHPLSLVS